MTNEDSSNLYIQLFEELSMEQLEGIDGFIDHWDASEQFYAKLPLIGTIIRLIRRRLKAS